MPDALHRFNDLIGQHRSRGVLLDANLLVLYIVGNHDLRLIQTVKATREFGVRDFVFIAQLVAHMDRLVTTPHVLTEVNGLANTGVPRRHRYDFLSSFRGQISDLVEVASRAKAIASDDAFLRLGLTDAAILELAKNGPLVVSTDLDLCVALESKGLTVVNYNHIRFAT